MTFVGIASSSESSEQVTDMLVAVLNTCSQEELMESSDEESVVVPPVSRSPDAAERRRIVRSKILAVGRMARVFSVLRLAIFPFRCSCPHAEFVFVARSQNEYQNSKACLARPSCRLVLWPWVQKESRMPSGDSMTRKTLFPHFPASH
jgi:hypothetical protein